MIPQPEGCLGLDIPIIRKGISVGLGDTIVHAKSSFTNSSRTQSRYRWRYFDRTPAQLILDHVQTDSEDEMRPRGMHVTMFQTRFIDDDT